MKTLNSLQISQIKPLKKKKKTFLNFLIIFKNSKVQVQKFLKELQKKTHQEAQEELIKNQIEINLKRNNILINTGNDENKAIKLIEEDPYLKDAIKCI